MWKESPSRKRDSLYTHASWLRAGCMPLHRSHRRARDIGMSVAVGSIGLPLHSNCKSQNTLVLTCPGSTLVICGRIDSMHMTVNSIIRQDERWNSSTM